MTLAKPEIACGGEDPEIFFPHGDNVPNPSLIQKSHFTAAKRICNSCVVREECLEGAIERDEKHGIWGGLTTFERTKLQKQVNRLGRASVRNSA